MLTANAPNGCVAGLALGADDYLSKPFHSPSSSSVSVALARRKPTSNEFGVLEALLKANPSPVSAGITRIR
jgi:CheY-like chemotaxis protein